MQKHVENTKEVVSFLSECDDVEWINYPSLRTHKDYNLAKKLLPKGAGAIFSFGIKGGKNAGRKLIENVSLASHLANVGDAKTLIIHPASTTHQQMSKKALKNAGIKENLIRISVGLEDPSDIIEDLTYAIKMSQRN